MEALRTWTVNGDNPLTVAVYKPVMTIQLGDGPAAELTPGQVSELADRFCRAGYYFESEDPEDL